MITEINEIIKVGAVFKNGNIEIKWIIWNGRKYMIKKITYKWKTKKGDKHIYNFAITDGASIFEVSFIPEDLIWNLEKIHIL